VRLLQLLNIASHQEELQVPYVLKKYERGPDQRAPPALLALSPLGKSPVITDDSVTLAESGAIVGELNILYL
jgi:glutathione S-transferase